MYFIVCPTNNKKSISFPCILLLLQKIIYMIILLLEDDFSYFLELGGTYPIKLIFAKDVDISLKYGYIAALKGMQSTKKCIPTFLSNSCFICKTNYWWINLPPIPLPTFFFLLFVCMPEHEAPKECYHNNVQNCTWKSVTWNKIH